MDRIEAGVPSGKTSPSETLVWAYRRAGYFVVSLALKMRPRQLAQFMAPGAEPADWLPGWDPSRADKEKVEELLVSLYAGWAALLESAPAAPEEAEAAARPENERAEDWLTVVGAHREPELRRRAQEIVRTRWVEVKALAQALQFTEPLDGHDAELICAHASGDPNAGRVLSTLRSLRAGSDARLPENLEERVVVLEALWRLAQSTSGRLEAEKEKLERELADLRERQVKEANSPHATPEIRVTRVVQNTKGVLRASALGGTEQAKVLAEVTVSPEELKAEAELAGRTDQAPTHPVYRSKSYPDGLHHLVYWRRGRTEEGKPGHVRRLVSFHYKPKARKGDGEFFHPAAVWSLRVLFLNEAARLYPAMLSELQKIPHAGDLDARRTACRAWRRRFWLYPVPLVGEPVTNWVQACAQATNRASLRFGPDSEPIWDPLTTFRGPPILQRRPEEPGSPEKMPIFLEYSNLVLETPLLWGEGSFVTRFWWEPVEEPRELFEARARAQFEAELAEHVEAVEGLCQKRGWRRTEVLKNTEQFEWLAHALVGKQTFQAIAERVSAKAKDPDKATGEDGVRTAVNKLAELIGLERPAKVREALEAGREP